MYLPASAGTVPFSPTPDSAWEDTGSVFRARARTVSSSSTMATVAFTDANNADRDILIAQYVTRPLTAGQTITGAQALKAQCRCIEVNTGNNLFLTLGIRVINLIDGLVKKTVLAVTRDANEVDGTTLTNRQFTANSAATNYTTVEGDCLVIEIGLAGDPTGSNTHSGSLRLGDSAASDLAEDDTSTADNKPWVQLTDTLTFVWSVTAGSGSFSLTGTAVGLKFGHKIPVGSDTYSLTGSTVALKHGYKVAASAGSYSLSGSDVTLTYTGAGAPQPVFHWKRISSYRRYGISGRNSRSRVQAFTKLVPLLTTAPATGSVTLSIESGTFSLSGSDVGLKHGYKVPTESGTYTLTGSNVGLKRGYPIAAGSGSYVITGSDVSLLHGYKGIIGSGLYSLTGSDVGLKRGYPIAVNSGTYSFTGSNIALRHTWNQSIESGTYNLNGSNVGLKRGYPINVQSGNYTLTGTNINLKFGHSIPTESGLFLLSGSDIGFVRGHPLSIGSGSYSLDGTNVNLKHGYKVPVGSGSYLINGSSVDLRYSAAQPRLEVDPGVFSLSGSDVGLEHGWKLAIGSGAYSLTGSNVSLISTHNLNIGSGIYAITGSNVGLKRGYPIVIESGSYNLRSHRNVSGLQACYRFDGDLFDDSGNEKHLTSVDPPTFPIGMRGQCIENILGTDNNPSIINTLLSGDASTGPYTVSGWFRVNTIGNLFDRPECTVLIGDILRLGIKYSSGSLVAGTYDPLTGADDIVIPVTTGDWVNVALSVGAGANLYVNGINIGSPSVIGTFGVGETFKIQQHTPSFPSGEIQTDTVLVYNIELSPSEITTLATSIDPTETVSIYYNRHIQISSGSYVLTGSNVTLTYTPLHLPGGLVCATVYITPSVIGNTTIVPSISAVCELEKC
jgi:hypothetical protein